MSKLIYHSERFTIRAIEDGPAPIVDGAIDAIRDAVAKAMESLDAQGHLFVTVVSAYCLQTGEESFGFGLYQSGLQHIALCGGKPDDWTDSHEEFLDELRRTAAHEVVHYMQDLNGTLGASEADEAEAERLAYEMFPRELGV